MVSTFGGFLQESGDSYLLNWLGPQMRRPPGSGEHWLGRGLGAADKGANSMPQLTTLTLIIKKPSSFFFFLTFIDLFAGGGLHVLQRSTEGRGQLSKLLFSSQQMSVPAKLFCQPQSPALLLGIFFVHILPYPSPSRAIMGLMSSFFFRS